jgi:hypothetical protein
MGSDTRLQSGYLLGCLTILVLLLPLINSDVVSQMIRNQDWGD